jgi:hypothetical protein
LPGISDTLNGLMQGIGVYFLIPENYQEIQEFHHFPIIC